MYGSNHMTAGGWIVMILVAVIVLALVVATIAWTARERRRRRDSGPLARPRRWRSLTGAWRAARSRPISMWNCGGRSCQDPSRPPRATDRDRAATHLRLTPLTA